MNDWFTLFTGGKLNENKLDITSFFKSVPDTYFSLYSQTRIKPRYTAIERGRDRSTRKPERRLRHRMIFKPELERDRIVFVSLDRRRVEFQDGFSCVVEPPDLDGVCGWRGAGGSGSGSGSVGVTDGKSSILKGCECVP